MEVGFAVAKTLDDKILVAYADGELDALSAAEVESRLASDPKARSRLRIFNETSRVLRATFGRPLRALEPLPSNEAAGRWRFALSLAASLLAFAVSVGGAYMAGLNHSYERAELSAVEHWLEETAKYYQLYARDEEYLIELPASASVEIEHRLGGWFDRPLRIPDLSRHGVEFRGVRFVALEADPSTPDEAQPAALLVYKLPSGETLGICITAFSVREGDALRLSQQAGLNQLYWFQSGYAHVLMGEADPEVLHQLGQDVARQIGEI